MRRNYLIHYILSGYGSFITEDKQYRLCPGQGFFIEPGWTTCYRADKEEPWTYVWVGFNGTQAAELVKGLGLGRGCPVFSCAASKELEDAVEHLLLSAPSDALLSLNQHRYLLSFLHVLAQNLASEPESAAAGESRGNYHIDKALNFIRANYANQILALPKGTLEQVLYRQFLLYSFFSVLMQEDVFGQNFGGRKEKNPYVAEALCYISDHFAEPMLVGKAASHLGISRNYFFLLFKQSIGCSPLDYIIRFRLERAAELLKQTEYSVDVIAASCGYQEPAVFSRAFKKKYGKSPSQYRKEVL